MLTLLARDRGLHIPAGLSEPPSDQPQHLGRDADPGRDHLLRIDLTHRGIQREQHPRPPDHRGRMHPSRGHPNQPFTIRVSQPDRTLHLRHHDNSPD